ncbi:hypothetical protein BT69DRAFT_1320775 [Atractiella rhizophila]|nr:hypothetical protein BT69DRAFT_1320775 [Atractiella rhizophila]
MASSSPPLRSTRSHSSIHNPQHPSTVPSTSAGYVARPRQSQPFSSTSQQATHPSSHLNLVPRVRPAVNPFFAFTQQKGEAIVRPGAPTPVKELERADSFEREKVKGRERSSSELSTDSRRRPSKHVSSAEITKRMSEETIQKMEIPYVRPTVLNFGDEYLLGSQGWSDSDTSHSHSHSNSGSIRNSHSHSQSHSYMQTSPSHSMATNQSYVRPPFKPSSSMPSKATMRSSAERLPKLDTSLPSVSTGSKHPQLKLEMRTPSDPLPFSPTSAISTVTTARPRSKSKSYMVMEGQPTSPTAGFGVETPKSPLKSSINKILKLASPIKEKDEGNTFQTFFAAATAVGGSGKDTLNVGKVVPFPLTVFEEEDAKEKEKEKEKEKRASGTANPSTTLAGMAAGSIGSNVPTSGAGLKILTRSTVAHVHPASHAVFPLTDPSQMSFRRPIGPRADPHQSQQHSSISPPVVQPQSHLPESHPQPQTHTTMQAILPRVAELNRQSTISTLSSSRSETFSDLAFPVELQTGQREEIVSVQPLVVRTDGAAERFPISRHRRTVSTPVSVKDLAILEVQKELATEEERQLSAGVTSQKGVDVGDSLPQPRSEDKDKVCGNVKRKSKQKIRLSDLDLPSSTTDKENRTLSFYGDAARLASSAASVSTAQYSIAPTPLYTIPPFAFEQNLRPALLVPSVRTCADEKEKDRWSWSNSSVTPSPITEPKPASFPTLNVKGPTPQSPHPPISLHNTPQLSPISLAHTPSASEDEGGLERSPSVIDAKSLPALAVSKSKKKKAFHLPSRLIRGESLKKDGEDKKPISPEDMRELEKLTQDVYLAEGEGAAEDEDEGGEEEDEIEEIMEEVRISSTVLNTSRKLPLQDLAPKVPEDASRLLVGMEQDKTRGRSTTSTNGKLTKSRKGLTRRNTRSLSPKTKADPEFVSPYRYYAPKGPRHFPSPSTSTIMTISSINHSFKTAPRPSLDDMKLRSRKTSQTSNESLSGNSTHSMGQMLPALHRATVGNTDVQNAREPGQRGKKFLKERTTGLGDNIARQKTSVSEDSDVEKLKGGLRGLGNSIRLKKPIRPPPASPANLEQYERRVLTHLQKF